MRRWKMSPAAVARHPLPRKPRNSRWASRMRVATPSSPLLRRARSPSPSPRSDPVVTSRSSLPSRCFAVARWFSCTAWISDLRSGVQAVSLLALSPATTALNRHGEGSVAGGPHQYSSLIRTSKSSVAAMNRIIRLHRWNTETASGRQTERCMSFEMVGDTGLEPVAPTLFYPRVSLIRLVLVSNFHII